MDSTQKKVTRGTLQILLVISGVLAVTIMIYSLFGLKVVSARQDLVSDFSENWSVVSGVVSKRISLPKSIDLTSQGTLVISNVLPDSLLDSDVMCITTNHQNIDVAVDGISIYSYESRSVIGDFFGTSYRIVPLDSSMADKEISITYKTMDSVEKTLVASPVIGSLDAVIRSLISKNVIALVTDSFFLMTGAFFIVWGVIRKLKGSIRMNMASVMMGLFLILYSVYGLFQTGLVSYVITNESFLYILGYTGMMLFIVPLLIYFGEVQSFSYSALEHICELNMVCFIVQYVVYLEGAADFGSMELLTRFLWFISGIYMMYLLGTEVFRHRKKEFWAGFTAMTIFTAVALIQLIYGMFLPEISTKAVTDVFWAITGILLVIDGLKHAKICVHHEGKTI